MLVLLLLLLLLFLPGALGRSESTQGATRFSSAGSTVVMSARHAYTCYDQKHVASQDALRSSTFHCAEHQPAAIENLLLPKVMCCNAQECVPSFAEHRQRFPIESIVCSKSNEHCDIVLRCQGEFEEFCKVFVVALACVAVVILSQFCMQSRVRDFKITKHSLYEQDKLA